MDVNQGLELGSEARANLERVWRVDCSVFIECVRLEPAENLFQLRWRHLTGVGYQSMAGPKLATTRHREDHRGRGIARLAKGAAGPVLPPSSRFRRERGDRY